eukprot:7925345-Ditylum_brightwellii.AAC.1
MELGQSNFIIATNRLSGTDSMSFGWKICMQQGKAFIQHSGPTFGQTSLFRSEVYRILSVLLFLYYAKEYAQDDKCLNFQSYLDNESVITIMHQQKDYPYDYSFNTLASD